MGTLTATQPVTVSGTARSAVAFVDNRATNDARVLREAETLAAAGYAVTLVAPASRGSSEPDRAAGPAPTTGSGR